MGAFSLIVVINLLNRVVMSPVRKSISENHYGEKLNLVNMPLHIIEKICKYLMQRHPQCPQYPDIRGLGLCYHKDVLNLRLTCSSLYGMVNACRLEFSFPVDLAWFD